MRVIAGIGSRKAPEEALGVIRELGAYCRERGIFVRSGHASGADYAWEEGAKEKTIVFLPWRGFGAELKLLTPHITTGFTEAHPKAINRAIESVDTFHPAPSRLSRAGRALMARNYFQVMGAGQEEAAVGLVVCWAPESKNDGVEGGTGQAVRIARANGIAVLNLLKEPLKRVVKVLSSEES